MRRSPALFALALIGLALPAMAQGVPTFDVRPSCRGGSDTQAALDSCIRSENDAKSQLTNTWSQYPADARRACTAEAGSELASYVELLTCLQINKDVKTMPKDIQELGQSGSGAGSGGSSTPARSGGKK